MINSREDYENFIKDNNSDDLFLHVIFTESSKHTLVSKISVILIQNFRTEQLYHFSIDHQDSPNVVSITELTSDLKTFSGRFFVLDKKMIIQSLPIKNVLDINLGFYFNNKNLINIIDHETPAHQFLRQKNYSYLSDNKVVPLMKHREMVNSIFIEIRNLIKSDIFNESYFIRTNTEIIEPLSTLESNGIFVDSTKFKKYFEMDVINNMVYSQYNIYTSTGRPSNRFDGVNYAAIKKDDGSRECFVSRHGENGVMFMVDYSAFHPRIIGKLTNFSIPNNIDFYEHMATLLFKKQMVDFNDILDAKALTFRQLYGGVEEQYSHIQYFYNLRGFIDKNWDKFNGDGYVETPIFKRKIFKEQVHEATPNKLFNYILQATETEIAVPVLGKINDILYKKKSKAVMYIYDSILFDIHLDDLEFMKSDIPQLMRSDDKFPIKCYLGDSYGTLRQIDL